MTPQQRLKQIRQHWDGMKLIRRLWLFVRIVWRQWEGPESGIPESYRAHYRIPWATAWKWAKVANST